ncbi:cryptochrome circadian regulator 3b [Xyrauchen texanus]|uniref:cryptochrome circadian regulator 3b n=1 Tax=Xyrauchen texanus TaxID=154827 RepID=UPI002242A179|nr:cryptochrome circadian regulator 3b [Xyrauchen texanus]XP_051979947.1 cryptochrome circadian regulator 3b [Xyrauchen texanus]
MAVNSIHWFRKGLRLHDNPALLEAVKGADTLRCVYFLDPWFAGASNLGVNRWRFLLQSLEDLDCSLRKLNSCLFVIRGQPANIFPRLFKDWNVSRLTFECDSEPFGKERDAAIKKLASEAGVEVNVKISHTLYDLDKIMEMNDGQTPLTYKRFQTLVSGMSPPEPPVEPLTKELMKNCVTPVSDTHRERYGVPLLEELGFDTEGLAPAVWPGGESEALTRMDRHLGPESAAAWQENFERMKMNSSPLLASPLGLSPYLRFGCLSCRLYYYKLTELYKKVKNNGNPSISLYDKILWREFFYTAATNNPRFDQMEGNPFCIRIPWDKNAQALAKWAEAKTGFPWIDAIMTQLRQEGWIHHLARHAVACFLTRGDLWISWEEGMKVFEELLLDADWSVNAGSWLSHSCSSFFQQFFYCYCPVGFGRRIDPNGDFIRRYLPVLRDFPAKFIYDPWNAPEDVQIAAKCVIGVDYPKPMVNHAEASRLNIERMRQIYQHLSRYRGLSLLATVPSNHMEEMNVNEARGAAAPPTHRKTHRVRREQRGSHEQLGPSRTQHLTAKHQHALGHRTSPYTTQSNLTGHTHEFAVPQQPGRLFGPVWSGTGRRERESEQDGCHGENGPSSTLKVHQQDDEVSERSKDKPGLL